MTNSPREKVYYPIDFNACMAINASYMSALGDILNDNIFSSFNSEKYRKTNAVFYGNYLSWDLTFAITNILNI